MSCGIIIWTKIMAQTCPIEKSFEENDSFDLWIHEIIIIIIIIIRV